MYPKNVFLRLQSDDIKYNVSKKFDMCNTCLGQSVAVGAYLGHLCTYLQIKTFMSNDN